MRHNRTRERIPETPRSTVIGGGGGGGGGGGDAVAAEQGYELTGKVMLSSVVVLFAAVLLVLFLHLYLRWRLLRRSPSSLRRRAPRLVLSGDGDSAAAPRGLDPAVLGSLPVIVFSRGGGRGGEEEGAVAECAVCLSEFEEGEKVRALPRCGHRFHIQCIDMWFHSHSTCPLCRSAVEGAPPPPIAAADGCADPSSSSASGVGELRIDVARGSEEDLGLGLGLGEKSPGSRIVLLRRLLGRDLRVYRSAEETNLDQGERAPPPPPPPPPLSPPRAAAV